MSMVVLAESGDDYDTVMASCGKKYEVMRKISKRNGTCPLGEQMKSMYENPWVL